MDSLDPKPEAERDLGSLATPKRQEVLAPDIRPASEGACGHRSPLNYDHTRWAVCTREAGHSGDHRQGDLMWADGFMPSQQRPAKPTGQALTPREEANQRTKAKRRQRKRAKERQERHTAQLEFDLRRVLRAAASAMERCEVATDPSGAADEASDILAQVVTLGGELVCEHYGCRKARPNPPCKQVDTTPGGTWVYACGHLIGK